MKARLVSLLYAGLLLWLQPTQAASTPSPATPESSSALSFTLRQGFLIVVDGRIGGLEHLRFILDTGATHTFVSRNVAERLSVTPSLSKDNGSVVNFQRRVPVQWARFPELRVGPIVATNARMMVGDLSHYSELTEGIDAIVGLDLLGRCKSLQVDYEAATVWFRGCTSLPMQVRDADVSTRLREFPTTAAASSETSAPSALFITVTVQGRSVRLLLDTGFEGIAVFEDRLRDRLPHLHTHGGIPIELGTVKAQAGTLRGEQVRLPGLRIGNDDANTPIVLVRGDTSAVPPGMDGYIGPRAIRAKRLELNFANKLLRWQ